MKIYYKPRAEFYDGWNVIPSWTMIRIISFCKQRKFVRWHLRIRFFKWPFIIIKDDKAVARASALKWRNNS